MKIIDSFGQVGIILATLLVAGCADGSPDQPVNARNFSIGEAPAEKRGPMSPQFKADASATMPDQVGEATKAATMGRKIIYNAHLELVTEDLNKLETALNKLVLANKAYVADSDRAGSAGATRHGSWKIRVPVELYDPFVESAKTLGEVVSIKADSQDVSEEFYDLEAREVAKKVEETRLLKHLADSTGKLEEILTVERELSRVRSEIERMQGRLRALGNLTALATVTVSANEIKGYVPPQAPTLGTKLARAFSGSVETLQQFGEMLLIAFVGFVPWIPVVAIGLGIAYLIYRWRNVRILPRPVIVTEAPTHEIR